MSAFSLRDINLTKIESRPARQALGVPVLPRPAGAGGRPQGAKALATWKLADFLRVLGCYPKGD